MYIDVVAGFILASAMARRDAVGAANESTITPQKYWNKRVIFLFSTTNITEVLAH